MGEHNALCALENDGLAALPDGLFCLMQAVEVAAVGETPAFLFVFLILGRRIFALFQKRHILGLGRVVNGFPNFLVVYPLLWPIAEDFPHFLLRRRKTALIQAHNFTVDIVVWENDCPPLGIVGNIKVNQLLERNPVAALRLWQMPFQPGKGFGCGIKLGIEVGKDFRVNALYHFHPHIRVKGVIGLNPAAGSRNHIGQVNLCLVHPFFNELLADAGIVCPQRRAHPVVQYSRLISALAETGDFVRFRVKGGIMSVPAVAKGQHLNAPLAAAVSPLGRGVHSLEEVKEIVLGQTVQFIFKGQSFLCVINKEG